MVGGCWNMYVELRNCIFMYTICVSIGLKECSVRSQPFVKNQEWQMLIISLVWGFCLSCRHSWRGSSHPLPIVPVLVGQAMGRHLCLIKLVVSSRRDIYIYISPLTHQSHITFKQTNVSSPWHVKVGDMILQLWSSIEQKQVCAPLHLISDFVTVCTRQFINKWILTSKV